MKRLQPRHIVRMIFPIFLIVGIVLIAAGTAVYASHQSFRKHAQEAEAVITSIERYRHSGDTNYRVTVSYTVKGKTYSARLGVYHTGMYEGMAMTVYYDPQNPQKIQIESNLAFWILGGIGAGFILLGGGGLLAAGTLLRRRARLPETGTPVNAQILEVTVNPSLRVNGRSPFVIRCRGRDPVTGAEREFQSESLWFDPSPYLTGSYLRVYVDSKKSRRYLVDIKELKDTYEESTRQREL